MNAEIPSNKPSRHRRTFLSVAAGALVAGLGVAWWRQRSVALPESVLAALWAAEFEQPDGTPLTLAQFKGQPLVVNFWATWCTPCVEEMPLLNAFYQQNKSKSWQVLGLAIDQPSAVKRFLSVSGRIPYWFSRLERHGFDDRSG